MAVELDQQVTQIATSIEMYQHQLLALLERLEKYLNAYCRKQRSTNPTTTIPKTSCSTATTIGTPISNIINSNTTINITATESINLSSETRLLRKMMGTELHIFHLLVTLILVLLLLVLLLLTTIKCPWMHNHLSLDLIPGICLWFKLDIWMGMANRGPYVRQNTSFWRVPCSIEVR